MAAHEQRHRPRSPEPAQGLPSRRRGHRRRRRHLAHRPERRVRLLHRPVGFGQDDADQHPRLPGQRHLGDARRSADETVFADGQVPVGDRADPDPAPGLRLHLPEVLSRPDADRLRKRHPAVRLLQKAGAPSPIPWRSSGSSAWTSASTTGRRSYPAARCSGWPSPGPSSTSPEILLADEPTGNLDTKRSEEIGADPEDAQREGRADRSCSSPTIRPWPGSPTGRSSSATARSFRRIRGTELIPRILVQSAGIAVRAGCARPAARDRKDGSTVSGAAPASPLSVDRVRRDPLASRPRPRNERASRSSDPACSGLRRRGRWGRRYERPPRSRRRPPRSSPDPRSCAAGERPGTGRNARPASSAGTRSSSPRPRTAGARARPKCRGRAFRRLPSRHTATRLYERTSSSLPAPGARSPEVTEYSRGT